MLLNISIYSRIWLFSFGNIRSFQEKNNINQSVTSVNLVVRARIFYID